MATANLFDYLSEKFSSFSSKMLGSSLVPSSTAFLMSGNANFQQYDLSTIMSEVRNKSEFQIAINPNYQFLPLHRFTTGIFESLKKLNGLDKPNIYMNSMAEKGLSPYLFNFVSDLYQPEYEPCDSSLVSTNDKFLNLDKEYILSESHVLNQMTKSMKEEKVCSSQVSEMIVDVNHLPIKEFKTTAEANCDISPTMRLNIELSQRKTKEICKRSKKRRRRQKKSGQLNTSNSASDDDEAHIKCSSSGTRSVCFLSKSPDFGCTLSVTHTVQLPPSNSFLIPVTSDSEDDSEWEIFDEVEISAANRKICEIDLESSSPSNSSPIKSESFKSYFKPVDCSVHVSNIISFVVPEDDSNDDSDWDTCEPGTFPENTGFEVSGLFFTNLCTPHSYNKQCNSHFTSEEDSKDVLQRRAIVLEANNKWNKLVEDKKSKLSSKVTFAPDESLVKVHPVEMFERKGEWELYATARDRFKRKIHELEKIISPCLMPEHRSKIFKNMIEPNL